jgi:hypothetical protein
LGIFRYPINIFHQACWGLKVFIPRYPCFPPLALDVVVVVAIIFKHHQTLLCRRPHIMSTPLNDYSMQSSMAAFREVTFTPFKIGLIAPQDTYSSSMAANTAAVAMNST